MKKFLVFCCLLLILMPVSIFAAAPSPTEQLKPALEVLVAILEDETLKGDDKRTLRRDKIMAEVNKGFDFNEMSKRILGRTWRKIGDTERKAFIAAMTELLENVYLEKLESYTGGGIDFVGETVKKDRAQVTTIVKGSELTLPVHYILRLQRDKWMVYDINIEGVSLVKNYHGQFKSILRKDGFEGVMKVLDEKNRAFAESKKE
ncbi:MAG: hypothetical protein CSB23_02435 [Deltaproteobacteria bacterium]|nr:MAG: hypothetical protein CSB23_02435 [Deltaproteobacteria bacterium]